MMLKKRLGAFGAALLLTLPTAALAHSHGEHADHGKAEQKMDHKAMDHSNMKMGDKPVAARGVIKAIDHEGVLKVMHEPIEAWNMGAMQMKFKLAPSIDIHSLKVGQQIDFMTKTEGMGKYLITEIK